MRSYLDSKDPKYATINIMDNNKAINYIRNTLNISDTVFKSPIARNVIPDSISAKKPNIVLIIMESMSAGKMKHFGNNKNLTPFLDSLAQNALFFENFYSAGKHTFNGIFSTLFSFPALYRQHPMKYILKYNGMAEALSINGYSTTYFTTHDGQFDNVEGFLKANGFQNIVSQKDYPGTEVKTTLGVPDDYMFRFAIPYLNNLNKTGKPFFTVFMTASDHGPYYVPEYFKPHNNDIKDQIVEYADWSLNKFLNLAKQQNWYQNTLFIFVADHGAYMQAKYEIALNYFHVPFIVYSPFNQHIHKTYTKIGSQIDVFPTVMGLLNLPYLNNSLGIDLLKENRKYALLNDDDKIGIIDNKYLCIMKDYGKKNELYLYKHGDKTNYAQKYPDKVTEMVNFAKAHLQVTQYMISKKLTSED
jgi:phosphoglycerol transferase MdoB-like AlkP superfamily enzyme